LDFGSEKPIFLQIAQELEDAIFTGAFPEETQMPSTTEISVMYKINPATVLKGVNILVDEGIAYKKRGIGIFVSEGAVNKIRQKRQRAFPKDYIEKLIIEARKLGLTKKDLLELIKGGMDDE
jgi:DNA-binding transcriptional regulator YhcF (GntR family)